MGELVLSLDGEPVATVDGLWGAVTAARIGRRLPTGALAQIDEADAAAHR